jgi:NhaA family Na+:H+ antiporter
MVVPAAIHYLFNAGTLTQSGFGIPMATDIAFALGILSLAGKRVPVALKIFLTALAIIDDLGAITVIALFYTKGFSLYYFLGSLAVFILLFVLGKRKVFFLPLYIVGGIIMWYLMLKSGVHATISGVLLAFAIPFGKDEKHNLSSSFQHALHYPVAFVILPIFALANTAIKIDNNAMAGLTSLNSIGIIAGLFVGKFIGIFLTSYIAVKTNLASLAAGVRWRHIMGLAFLGGIGFTMSIFIANLAFTDTAVINESKLSILLASFVSALTGLIILKTTSRKYIVRKASELPKL